MLLSGGVAGAEPLPVDRVFPVSRDDGLADRMSGGRYIVYARYIIGQLTVAILKAIPLTIHPAGQ